MLFLESPDPDFGVLEGVPEGLTGPWCLFWGLGTPDLGSGDLDFEVWPGFRKGPGDLGSEV
jgi:hypothetical protein